MSALWILPVLAVAAGLLAATLVGQRVSAAVSVLADEARRLVEIGDAVREVREAAASARSKAHDVRRAAHRSVDRL
ncbi:MAG: hypothetical protein ACRD0U_11295 [Acidimicrobiales bacterium]